MMTVITAIFHCKNVLTKNVLPSVVMMMLSLLMMMMMMTGFQLSVIVFNISAKCRHHHHQLYHKVKFFLKKKVLNWYDKYITG